jgi:Uma2 family endonuclease
MSTITSAQSLPSPAPLASPAVYRLTVDEFERVADLLVNDQVELIDGYIVAREDMKPSHVLVTERLKLRLEPMVPTGWFIRDDKPIRIPDFDEPRPDVAVVRGDPELYANHHPAPADVTLLVEVSDATLPRDQGEKKINYARAGIPVYWIVNLVGRQIEVYNGPGSAGYALRADFRAGQDLPVAIDGIQVGTIAVDAILP